MCLVVGFVWGLDHCFLDWIVVFTKRVTAAFLAASLLSSGMVFLPAAAAVEDLADDKCNWFTETDLSGDAVSEAPGVLHLRYAVFDADEAVREIVSPQALGLAVPGQRVVVPSSCDPRLTLFDGDVVTIDIAEVAVIGSLEDFAPSIEVIGQVNRVGQKTSTGALSFTPDETGQYGLRGTLDNIDEAVINVVGFPGKQSTYMELMDPLQIPRPAETPLGPKAPLSPTTHVDESAVVVPESGYWTVDLLVGYHASWQGLHSVYSLLSTTRFVVAETNAALVSSGVSVRLNLVGFQGVDLPAGKYPEVKVLEQLRMGEGPFGVLLDKRDELGADLVHFAVGRWTQDTCGAGYSTVPSGSPEFAFSVSSYDCLEQLSFTHLLGLNLGAGVDGLGPFDFSRGHSVARVARSVMGVRCSDLDWPSWCARRLQFSSPGVDFLGFPGVASGGELADNARSMNLMAPVVAGYRDSKTVRFAGGNRFETSAVISRSSFPDPGLVDVVVVATGSGFADALSAAPLAARLGGPLLLSGKSFLDEAVSQEIIRLQPGRVIVVGSPKVISDAVGARLQTLVGPSGVVERVYGSDRYATSLQVAKRGWGSGASSVFVASGADFPDALSAGAAAGMKGAPVVLVPGRAKSAPKEVADFLQTSGTREVLVAGGMQAVSSGVAGSLAAGRQLTRYAGANRFETSALIGNAFNTKRASIYLASGGTFPDALSGAAVAGANRAPVLLSKKNCIPTPISQVIKSVDPTLKVLLGGTVSLSNQVMKLKTC